MILTLSPQFGLPGQPETTLAVAGDTLIIDGTAFDLSDVPDGTAWTPPEGSPFIGSVVRSGGVLYATVCVRLGPDAWPEQPEDPAHWIVEVADGPVTIPAMRKTEIEGLAFE